MDNLSENGRLNDVKIRPPCSYYPIYVQVTQTCSEYSDMTGSRKGRVQHPLKSRLEAKTVVYR